MNVKRKSIETQVEKLTELFDRELRFQPGNENNDLFESTGKNHLASQFRLAIFRNKPIDMLLPGFPHKNPNHQKTLGLLPDLAEQLVLERLNNFCEAATQIYCPQEASTGCRITIFSDGRIWGDLLGVPLQTILNYSARLRDMLPAKNPHIRFNNLDTHFDHLGDNWVSEAMEKEWPYSPPSNSEPDTQVQDRFCRLTYEDRTWSPQQSESEIEQICHDSGVRMMRRLNSFRLMLDNLYANSVRLSVHAGASKGPQFSVRIFPEAKTCELPYHKVVVLNADGDSPKIMKHHQANQLPGGVFVVYKQQQPWCLQRHTTD